MQRDDTFHHLAKSKVPPPLPPRLRGRGARASRVGCRFPALPLNTDCAHPCKVTMMMPAMTGGVQFTFEVKFESDLPNGPYGTVMGMTGVIHVPPGSTYDFVQEATLKAWRESRADMANMVLPKVPGHVHQGTYKESWDIKSIKYKGGDVNMSEEVCATNCLEPWSPAHNTNLT